MLWYWWLELVSFWLGIVIFSLYDFWYYVYVGDFELRVLRGY